MDFADAIHQLPERFERLQGVSLITTKIFLVLQRSTMLELSDYKLRLYAVVQQLHDSRVIYL